MGYTHGTSKDSEFRICSKCGIEFPNTNEYFQYASKKDNRLSSMCKPCQSEVTKKRNLMKTENNKKLKFSDDIKKTCIKCHEILPATLKYFPKDLSCNGGLRNVCRCCGKDGHYMDDEYIPNERWSDEEIDLLKQIYKHFTGEEIKERYFPNRSIRAIECCADTNGFSGKTEETILRSRIQRGKKISVIFKGRKLSTEQCLKISKSKIEYYKTHHGSMYGKKFTENHRKQISERNTMLGKWKGKNNPRYKNPLSGELNGNWKGGITNLYQELRSDSKEWQENSMEFCNYRCVITNGWFDNIHHLTPFRDIVNETFLLLKLNIRQKVLDYSKEEWLLISEKLKDLHNYYGHGVALCKPIHKLFHDNYGYTKNTPYQFLDFIYRLDIGEFDDWLHENTLQLNINYPVIEEIESSLLLQRTA